MNEENKNFNIEDLLSEVNKDDLFQIIKTDQSFHEGTGLVKEYVKKAKKLGIKNLVLADRNTLAAMVKFYRGCKAEGINPIIGNTLRMELPDIDVERSLIKNQDKISKINSFKNILNQGVDIFTDFSSKDSFENFTEVKGFLLKHSKSKSKTKELILLKEINGAFSEALDREFSLIPKEEMIRIEEEMKLDKSKKYDLVKAVSEFIDIPALSNLFVNLELELETSDILVIARNDIGFKNIKELISLAYLEGQENVKTNKERTKREVDSFPIITMETLKKYSDGIRVYLGDKKDALGKTINESNKNGEKVLNYFKEELGDILTLYIKKSTKNDSPKNMIEEKKLNIALIKLSNKFKIPCVGTHDARFVEEEDYFIHDIKRSILLKENIDAFNRKKEEFTGQYLISNEDLIERFKNYPELLLNNNKISQTTNIFIKLGKCILPNFDIPEDFSNNTLIEHSASSGLDSLLPPLELKNNLITYYTEEIKEKFPEDEWEYEKENKINNIISGKYMEDIAWAGVEEKMLKKLTPEQWAEKRDHYLDRCKFEAKVVNDMGFPGYFLIVQEFINWAKNTGVPVGPGRGSGAGSLIAFGLSITTLDPIKDDLLFERFLNPARVSMPDFDIDFGDGFDSEGNKVTRDDVIEHVKDFYQNLMTGQPTVGQIATNGEFGVKSGIKAVAKSLGHTVTFETNLTKMVDSIYDKPDLKFAFLFEDAEFVTRYETEAEFKKIIDLAKRLNGSKQNTGVHAGGVVISPTTSSLSEFSAIQCSPDGSGLITQLDKDDVEEAGLVKFDFLGLKTLSVIQEALKRINTNPDNDFNIDIDMIPEDDENTFKMLKAALTHGVFQIESAGMTKLVEELQVNDIPAISDLLALYRPGPMQSGMMDDYVIVRKKILEKQIETGINIEDISITDIDNKILSDEELEAFTPIHIGLLKTLEPTNNQMIYQEQVMQAGQVLAGYSLAQADMLRRAIGKKKVSEMIKQKKMFSEGAFNKYREELKEKTLNSPLACALDISLTDISEKLAITKYIDYNEENDTSYFSTELKIIEFFKEYLNYNDNDITELESSIGKYKVSDFKQLHSNNIKNGITKKASDLGLSVEEGSSAFYRIYYALTQFTRFNNVFSAIEKFAAYGFNKSHSLAYANVSYQTAYLKANHSVEFFAATMTFQHDELEKLNATVADARKNFDIKVLSTHINESDYLFKPISKDNSIRFGLSAIKGLGANAEAIQKEREENGNFNNLQDLLLRIAYRNILNGVKNTKLNARAMDGLVYSGALDCFVPDFITNNPDFKSDKDYLLHQYEQLTDKHMYPPKDKLIKMVKRRFETGSYNESIHFDLEQLNFNDDIKNFYATEIAYTKDTDLIGKAKIKYASINEKVSMIIDGYKDGTYIHKYKELKGKVVERTNVDQIYNLTKEKEFTGIYVNVHPVNVNGIKSTMRVDPKAILHDINQVTPEKQGNTARVVGVVNEIRLIIIKNGNNAGEKMAILTLEDDTDTINITLFSDAYKKAKNFLEINSLLAFDGEITYSEQYGLGLNANGLKPLIPDGAFVSLEKAGRKRF
jgi:DNA polymerase III alpha subunit